MNAFQLPGQYVADLPAHTVLKEHAAEVGEEIRRTHVSRIRVRVKKETMTTPTPLDV